MLAELGSTPCWTTADWPVTTRKMRSWLQPQAHKAGVVAQAQCDLIVVRGAAKLTMRHAACASAATSKMLPSVQHPFDHHTVEVELCTVNAHEGAKTENDK